MTYLLLQSMEAARSDIGVFELFHHGSVVSLEMIDEAMLSSGVSYGCAVDAIDLTLYKVVRPDIKGDDNLRAVTKMRMEGIL